MQSKKYRAAVVIGRFQPFHNGHRQLMREALKVADTLIVIVGSTNIPRTPKNPFTLDERRSMIFWSMNKDRRDAGDVKIYGVEDTLYSDQQWAAEVQFSVQAGTDAADKDIVLVGHHRDDSSYYLDMFPQWKFLEVPAYEDDISGTAIRNAIYEQRWLEVYDRVPGSAEEVIQSVMQGPEATAAALANDDGYTTLQILINENQYIKDYKALLATFPYGINLVTTDAVVVQSGHVLMIKRGGFPGKGLWALPGGYLDTSEFIKEGIIRELREETKLKVPEKVLKGSIRKIEVFDAPGRSERGRVITHAALFVLEEGHTLPKVKGSDDADEARWIPISMLRRMRSEIFEDHYDIIFKMTSNL